jgi:hypothetical protein
VFRVSQAKLRREEPRKTRKKADDKSAHRRRRNNLNPVDPKICLRNLGARIVFACAHAAPLEQKIAQ